MTAALFLLAHRIAESDLVVPATGPAPSYRPFVTPLPIWDWWLVTLIPLFIQLRNWNLLDSLPGLALVYVAFNVPLAVWLMREYLRGNW